MILDEADAMTRDAQNALRRSRKVFKEENFTILGEMSLLLSCREIHGKHSLLLHMQLPVKNHTRAAVSLYAISIWTADRGADEAQTRAYY